MGSLNTVAPAGPRARPQQLPTGSTSLMATSTPPLLALMPKLLSTAKLVVHAMVATLLLYTGMLVEMVSLMLHASNTPLLTCRAVIVRILICAVTAHGLLTLPVMKASITAKL